MFKRLVRRFPVKRRPAPAVWAVPGRAPDSRLSRLGTGRYCLFGLGATTSTFGLAITLSVFAAVLAGGKAAAQVEPTPPVGAISYRVVAVPGDIELQARSLDAAREIEEMTSAQQPASGIDWAALLRPSGRDTPSQAAIALPPKITFAAPPDSTRIQALGLASGPALPAPSQEPQVQAPAQVPAPSVAATQPPAAIAPALVLATPVPIVVHAPEDSQTVRRLTRVNLTFYDCRQQGFCGTMANGRKVYEGAAACSYDLPLGTRFYIEDDPTNRIYRCEDRGLLSRTWVDIFWNDPVDGWRWQAAVGRYGTIVIVEWGD